MVSLFSSVIDSKVDGPLMAALLAGREDEEFDKV